MAGLTMQLIEGEAPDDRKYGAIARRKVDSAANFRRMATAQAEETDMHGATAGGRGSR